jgi:glycosyltransferase involved in cell wall biosynthesis
LKVLHIINTLSAGGAELHLLTLCRILKRKGVDVSVACLREQVKGSRSLRQDFENENIRIFNLQADWRYNVKFLGRLLSLVKQVNPQVLHSHLPRADIASTIALCLPCAPAFLCSVHGIYADRWFGYWAAPLMRTAYRKADAVIAISGAVRDWLRLGLGVNDEKISVIRYGIEPERFIGTDDEQGNETEKHPCRLIIGSIGRLEPGKGFECLIRAMQMVRAQMPGASLLIAGHDPLGYGKNLASLIAELSLNEHVRLVGFHNDVPSFLRGLDVFVFASRSEGFGQVVIEAMAAGRSVVASKIPPLTEIVIDGDTGLLAECDSSESFASSLIRLLKDPVERQRMGARGRERVREYFTAERMTQETLLLYENLLGQKSEVRSIA